MDKLHLSFIGIGAFVIFFISSCGILQKVTEAQNTSRSTWRIIQQDIFEPKCVVCHRSGTSYYTQSRLDLTEEMAYRSLVNVTPNNSVAAIQQLVLLSTISGIEALSKSFLWKKIDPSHADHLKNDQMGSLMPIGNKLLTQGELKFIESWIKAGAPKTGIVANESYLRDTSQPSLNVFIPLETPSNGMQIRLGPFSVSFNFEREFLYYYPLYHTEPIYINRIDLSMRPGTHHFIMYLLPPTSAKPVSHIYRDIRTSSGENNNVLFDIAHNQAHFLFGSQWLRHSSELPAGVAFKIEPGSGFDFNSHYPNYSPESIQGEIYINLYTIQTPQKIAKIFQINNTKIYLPPKTKVILKDETVFNERRYVFQLVSHMHAKGQSFKTFIKGGKQDGKLIYEEYDWQHPTPKHFDPPLILEAGQGLRIETSYYNPTDQDVFFGLKSTDEMMILYGFYYTE